MTPDPETLALPAVTEETAVMPVVPDDAALEPVTEPSFQGASLTGQPVPRPFPYIAIGDWLTTAKPGFDILPCGHCGARFTAADPAVLSETRTLGVLRHLAYEAGWEYDFSLKWTCPDCRALAAAVRAEADALLAGGKYPDLLREFDVGTRATMTAGGRYPWDYDGWRDRFAYTEDVPPVAGGWAA